MPCLPLADYPMRPPLFPLLQAAAVVMLCLPARAAIVVVDAGGVTITLAAPAQRIVSLAPNLTELLFAAGAGERVVGSVDFSDYPAAARALPRVGGHSLDLEADGGARYVGIFRTDGSIVAECILDWKLVDRETSETRPLPDGLAEEVRQ